MKFTVSSLREYFGTALPFIVLTAVLLSVAYWVLDPTPPKHVVLATGVDQGAYAEFGKRYAELLKQQGITVELRPTQGAAENLRLLRDAHSGVDIAFVQGGADPERAGITTSPEERRDTDLVSLGSMFYEPVWLFYREASAQKLLKTPQLASLSQLTGWKVNIGAQGSGVPNLMSTLLTANSVLPDGITLMRESQTPATMALLDGGIDALVFASAPESLMVQMLLQTPGIRLFDFAQADAYSRRFGFLTPVLLPRGVVDLARDIPPADVRLIAPTATLVARESLHPALVQLFVQAAQKVHSPAGWFQRKGDFPNAHDNERTLDPEAERFYKQGAPLLQRWLPFWLANLIDRMWIVLLSLVAVILPMSRVVPPLVEFRIRSRIFKWYGQLRAIDEAGGRSSEELLKTLADIESRVAQVTVPLSYADELYALRSHIQLVRRRLESAQPSAHPA